MLAISVAVLTLFLGCAKSPNVPENLVSDKNLPVLSDIAHISDINSVGFEWESIKNPSVMGFLIYRGKPNEKLDRVGAVDNRFATHYIDNAGLEANTDYIYRFSLYTKDGRESVPSNNVAVRTKPLPEPVSFIETVPNLPRMSKIIFRPHPSERIDGYIIERRVAGEEKWQVAGKLNGRLHAEFFDANLKDHTEYNYRVIAKTHDGLQLLPSDIVISITKALPVGVQNLIATNDLPKQIEIKWDKHPNDGNGSYNLYSSSYEKIGYNLVGNFKTNGAVEKLAEDGAVRYYKVSFLDSDSLESELPANAVKGATLGKPNPPKITKIAYENGKVTLAWESADQRNTQFVIKRVTVAGIIKKDEKRSKSQQLVFEDKDAKAGVTYQYTVIGIDQNAIESNESESARITIDSSGAN